MTTSGAPFVPLFERWFCGNGAAVAFAGQLWEAAQLWDDLEDEGKTRHNALISWLAFEKEYQPFFAAHAGLLRPALLLSALQWRAANVLDRGERLDVAKSYMLRAQIYGVFHLIAWICGGDAWAEEIGPEIYRTYGETPEGLWEEMQNA